MQLLVGPFLFQQAGPDRRETCPSRLPRSREVNFVREVGLDCGRRVGTLGSRGVGNCRPEEGISLLLHLYSTDAKVRPWGKEV